MGETDISWTHADECLASLLDRLGRVVEKSAPGEGVLWRLLHELALVEQDTRQRLSSFENARSVQHDALLRLNDRLDIHDVVVNAHKVEIDRVLGIRSATPVADATGALVAGLRAEVERLRSERRADGVLAEQTESVVTEAIARWLEREFRNDSPAAIKAIAADIREGKWRRG